ncbi:MAG: clan AA aspartic protease [Bacteroidetes bacterium HGW-Bacteroidetes-12]|nr:MAG: clan AA aspartic protease [Bacteroidetes bacterium HGW-Bacteroidetes-12]
MTTKLSFEILPIENDGFHLQLKVRINGSEANLILDTGASRSVFDETRITLFTKNNHVEDNERLSTGLGTNTMTSKNVILEKLELNELIIENYEATILDLTHVNESYEKLELELIDGVLGSDILVEYNAIIDYGKKELVFSSKTENK